MQVEKHNTNVYPMFRILMALDIWEHACYLDHQNDRGKFVKCAADFRPLPGGRHCCHDDNGHSLRYVKNMSNQASTATRRDAGHV